MIPFGSDHKERESALRAYIMKSSIVRFNALPETFVDHAEEIWTMLAEGKTQQQGADELNVTQPRVTQYGKLENLYPNVWGIITGFINSVMIDESGSVIKNITTVITENLLRNILDLTETHQLKIISDLINGTIKNGQVKNKAALYREYEKFALYAVENLSDKADTPAFFNDCLSGLYPFSFTVKNNRQLP